MRAVNLIPSESRTGSARAAGRSGGGAYAVLAVLGGLAILALLYGIAHHQILSREAQAATLSAQFLRQELGATQFCELDPDEFYDFQEVRPVVSLGDHPRNRSSAAMDSS